MFLGFFKWLVEQPSGTAIGLALILFTATLILRCGFSEVYTLERTGASGRHFASPVAANGRIYLTSRDGGVVTVLKAGTTKPELIVRNPTLGERVVATPAIANNVIYIRTGSYLCAFAERN
jgi:outer membrane protein assembly factor BamB